MKDRRVTTNTAPPASTAQAPQADALIIGTIKFTEAIPPAVRGAPSIRFTKGGKYGSIALNAAAMAQLPELAPVDHLRVYVAEGSKPAVALFPAAEGQGVRFFLEGGAGKKAGRKKISGKTLVRLDAYARIEFRAEAIESPRKGWVLHPISSERAAT